MPVRQASQYQLIFIQRSPVTETAHWLEWQDWADPILLKSYDIKDGLLHIPDMPGVGLDWNEDAITANAARL